MQATENTGLERSSADLLRDTIDNAQDIIRSEIRLAVVEVKEQIAKTGVAIAGIVMGSIVALYGVSFLLVSAYDTISYALWPWLAALLIGGFLSLIGGLVARAGLRRLKKVRAVPAQTVETLKEDVRWLQAQMK